MENEYLFPFLGCYNQSSKAQKYKEKLKYITKLKHN